MKKVLYLFISLFFCSFICIKVNANNNYDTNGSYRFFITSEQKIVIYENYGSNRFYSGIYECGLGLDETGTFYQDVNQIRGFINGENKILFVDQTGLINWSGPSSGSSDY